MTDTQYKTSIVKIVKVLDITSIYYVDDELEEIDAPTQEEIIAKLEAPLSDELRTELVKLIPSEILNARMPKPRKRGLLNSHISQADDRTKLLRQLGKKLGMEWGVRLNIHARFLQEVFKSEKTITLNCIGPKKWRGIMSQTIKGADSNSRVLCLFDQNLKEDDQLGGSGLGLVHEAIRIDGGKEHVFCVLFTSEITGEKLVDAELSYWNKKIHDSDLASSQFFSLSKDRTQSNQSFAEGIKLSSLNSLYDILRVNTFNLIQVASDKATTALNRVHLYNLDYMVNTSSKIEGIWEAETLKRLYGILREEKIKEEMIDTSYPETFNKNLKKVGEINTILKYIPEIPVEERYKLRRQELYEKGKLLNGMHSPIQTGDIFQNTPDGKDFVILAQPCDLQLRTNGKRKSAVVTAAPISVFSEEAIQQHLISDENYLKGVFELEYYNEDGIDKGYVEFNNTFSIEIDVLDLAVLNDAGQCVFDTTGNASSPAKLYVSWEKRFKWLKESFNAKHETIRRLRELRDKLGAQTDDGLLLTSIMPSPFKDLSSNPKYKVPEITFSGSTLDYNLQRIAGIRHPLSAYLLDAYTKYLSRTALEHDFSLEKKKKEKV